MNRNNEGVVASSVSPVMSCNEKIELYWSSNCECDICMHQDACERYSDWANNGIGRH